MLVVQQRRKANSTIPLQSLQKMEARKMKTEESHETRSMEPHKHRASIRQPKNNTRHPGIP
jgi:hypothetical protein